MPKSNSTMSPTTHNKQASDEPPSRMSDVALRKKKNADAQAAFRARRANYIATLEETVTSLESVVLQLQESCREARHESQELRQENVRLRHELREREKFWRTLWQARKPAQGAESDDPPPLPASFSSPHPSNGHMSSIHMHQFGGGALPYRMVDDASVCNGSYETNPSHYHNHPSSLSYGGVEADISGDIPSNPLAHRGSKYNPFTYPIPGIPREASWPSPIAQSTSSGGDSGGATHSSHSPSFAESPTLTSTDMSFVGRFPPEDQKVPLSSLDTAPYAFPNSRSISPTTSTPGSSSSTPLTPFQFTFSDNGGRDRSDLDYRRHSHPHGAEVTLHGGTADISSVGPAGDAVRYRLAPRRDHSASDRPLLPALPPMSGSDNGSQHEQGSSDGDSTPYPHSHSRLRRGMTHSRSRSPSPVPPILSGTLAVIKAQAFGALRRTRTRTKKSSEGAAKVAMNVLESRGIGIPPSPSATPSLKRQRLDDDLDLPQA
ncbi:hypothetical protein D9615_010062 [Tricholomella constricta]|uniref:BZIP domain-containing protein n=1 Tax=Tricholomella constricta TaxID=117010 RepID=A0A8H5GS64_9AGAR|nr:hypothetical protein D9615_010062 [Tricholomella constricta]